MINKDTKLSAIRSSVRRPVGRRVVEVVGFLGLCAVVSISAIVVKEGVSRRGLDALASVTPSQSTSDLPLAATSVVQNRPIDPNAEDPTGVADIRDPLAPRVEPVVAVAPAAEPAPTEVVRYAPSTEVRYFNGRPIRPSRTIRMVVTAYSPDQKSCGPNARGITSSVHSVKTHAMKLVAADSRVLPLGSMISVPGYDESNIVPVLDRGGAIKGNRLDVLFPTDAAARQWGVKKLDVVVWEYADNLPADDFRAIRDSRN